MIGKYAKARYAGRMNPPTGKPPGNPKQAKRERLNQALKANLKRRKAATSKGASSDKR